LSKRIIKKTRREKPNPPMLDKKSLLEFISKAGGHIAKRDIAKHFNIKGDERRKLNAMLRDMDSSGELNLKNRREISSFDAPPKSGIYQAVSIDENGELWAQQIGDDGLLDPKFIIANPLGANKGDSVGIGEKFVGLARKSSIDDSFEIKIIKKLGAPIMRIFGVLHQEAGQVGQIIPADKKYKHELMVLPQHLNDAQDGDLVAVRELPSRGYGPKKAEILEIFGKVSDPRAASILAIAAHNIPTGFTDEEEEQANQARPVALEYRKDLRDIPFVTIDPDDARDHDDAVYAQATPNGHKIWVAIADVAHYVTPGSALDKGSINRGNSVYFPDRVVPMLPFKLSADLCSLRENEERACLAVEINIDDFGELKGFQFYRGLMRSVARLTYTQAQWAIDGKGDEKTLPILDDILKPLWAAYSALKIERASREPLDIASSERKIIMSADGKIESITQKERFDAHKLIEEFMILANVCAATAVENKQEPLIYRVHDMPSATKVASLADFLATLNIRWTKGEVVSPKRFNRILEFAKQGESFQTINEMVLRTQAQAVYSTDNIGHFGLQLHKYAHFTSPIRRYADLCVHRALIDTLQLGGIGYGQNRPTKPQMQQIAQTISDCERRAMAAERDATDRYLAAYLSERVGASFDARITSVTNFGVFVRLDETMGDGLVPLSRLGDEYFFLDEESHALIGSNTGDRWQLGMKVRVRLLEAAPITGGLMFDIISDPKKGPIPKGRNMGRRGISHTKGMNGKYRPSSRPKSGSTKSGKPKSGKPSNKRR
jgi:ribonuclease R